MLAKDLLVVEVANTLQCESVDDATVPRSTLIEADRGPWVESRRLRLESPRLDAVFHSIPAGFENAPQLRFRPTGRIFTRDTFIGDDNVVIEIVHPVLLERRHVLVMNNGFLCIPQLGVITPSTTPTNYRCGGA